MKRAGFEVPTFALQLSKLRGKRKKDVSRRPPEREAVGRPRSERTIRAKQRKDKMVHRQARMDKQAEEQASRKRKRKPQALSSDWAFAVFSSPAPCFRSCTLTLFRWWDA